MSERHRVRAHRSARQDTGANGGTFVALATRSGTRSRRILIVDLNNFASFPTLAIGLLTASLRNHGHEVQVICPLAYDVPATERERQENVLDHLKRRLHLSTMPLARTPRNLARVARTWWLERPHPGVLREVEHALDDSPDIVLLSAYLQHFNTVGAIGRLAHERDVPVVVGGPMFNVEGVADAWRSLPGINCIAGAEMDHDVAGLVEAICTGEPVSTFSGLMFPDGTQTAPARPLRNLDQVPMADFSDFPWDRYPVRIVPMMTGRGCQWDKCMFCSDVISASGRTFRTRSVTNVLVEMQEQARRHETTNFLFLDLKLNSYPDMLRGIAAQVQDYVQGAEWIGTVHVDLRHDNGLSKADLRAAVTGGMRRISFGLESGSQRLLDLMRKGTSVEANSEFIRSAFEAGLSIRCTMFKGYPGETAEDMAQTAEFLERHTPFLDRVRFNEFSLMENTPIYNAMVAQAGDRSFGIRRHVHRRALADYFNREGRDHAYRRAKARALNAVYDINRRPVRTSARQFDGLM
jgi:anaerobic magnesium-protoporphyrin IX monomethyl ester cyclase